MSKEIKIIEREVQDTRLLSREEREARLKEAEHATKLPHFHFDNFLELDDITLATENKRTKPDILALLLRKLLVYDAVIPIVASKINRLRSTADIYDYFDIPMLRAFGSNESSNQTEPQDINLKSSNLEGSTELEDISLDSSNSNDSVVGGKKNRRDPRLTNLPKKSTDNQVEANQLKVEDTSKNAVSVQINGIKKFIHLDDVKQYIPGENTYLYQTSNNDTIHIVGLFINHTAPLVKYFRDRYPWSMNAIVAIMSGTYSTSYLHNRLFSPVHVVDEKLFMKNLQDFVPGLIAVGNNPDRMYYLFESEEQTKHICASLFEYLVYLESTYTSLQQSILIHQAFTHAENIAGSEPAGVAHDIAESNKIAKQNLESQFSKKGRGEHFNTLECDLDSEIAGGKAPKTKKPKKSPNETKTSENTKEIKALVPASKTDQSSSSKTAKKPLHAPKFSELFKLMAVMITKFYVLPTGVEPVDVKIDINTRVGELLTQLQPFMSRKRQIKYESSLRYDLWINDMFELFEKFYISLDGNADVRKDFASELKELLLTKAKEEYVSAELYVRQQREFTALFSEMRYRWIYIQKFGWDKFVTLYSAPIGKYEWKNMRLAPIMSLLPKNVADIIEVEYKRIEKYTDALYNNNCPHLGVEATMRSTEVISERHAAYNELRKYISANDQNLSRGVPSEMIICSSCKFPLICPHIRDLYELEKNRKTDDEIREFINKYSGNAPVDRHYYCRICGEPISDSTELDVVVAFAKGEEQDYHYADDELRDFIWQEASSIVRSFTEFKGIQTNKFINKFISTIVNNVYEFVFAIEKKIIKAKTSSIDEIRDKRKLYTIIYVIAFLVKVIGDNYDRLRFATRRSADQQKPAEGTFSKEAVGKLLGYAFKIITSSQNVLISRIEGMSDTVIQNSLLKAYKVITSLLTGKAAIPQVKDEEIITTLLLDPLYWYIVDAGIRTKLGVGAMANPSVAAYKRLRDSYLDPKVSLGRDIKTMEKSSYVFEGINEPIFQRGSTDAFTQLVEKGTADKDVFVENGLYSGYWEMSFQHVFEYIHSRMYIHPLWKVDIIALSEASDESKQSEPKQETTKPTHETAIHKQELSADDGLRIEINKPYADYFAKYEKLATAERILFDLILYEKMRTLHTLPFRKYMDFVLVTNPDATLALAYGAELNTKFPFKSMGVEEPKRVGFHTHKWDLILYAFSAASKQLQKKQLFNAKDMSKKIEQEAASKEIWHVEDVYCSVCYFGKSSIVEEFAAKKIDIIELLEEQQQLESFYNFYASQCPYYSDRSSKTGDTIHEYNEILGKSGSSDKAQQKSSTQICKNCGYEKIFGVELNKTYYHKWLATFKKDLAIESTSTEVLAEAYDSKKIVEAPASIVAPKLGDDIKKWKYNLNVATELANTLWDSMKGPTFKNMKKPAFYNAIVNLGLSQDLNYDDILAGKVNPYHNMSYALAKRRENQVGTYVYKLMVDYNTLRNYKNIPTLPTEFKELITPGILKVLDKLPNFTPDFTIGYSQMKRLYYSDSDAVLLANWVAEFLCKTLLRIYKAAKETAPFLAYYIGEILETERAISKPKENKMAQVLANTKAEIETIIEDQPMSDAFNTVAKKDADPVGYDDMDYDGHNDKVGEGNADDLSV